MTENELINNIVKSSTLIGKLTQIDFINSYQTDESTYNVATELETSIYGFFLIDYFLHSKTVNSELRQKYFNKIIDELISEHGSELTNNNLDELIEYRFNKYAEIIESAGEKWQQRINAYLENNIKGTKNRNTISKVYPLEIMDAIEEHPYKTAFIQGFVHNIYRASIIAEGLNKGKSLDETTKSIAEIEGKGNSNKKKKGCYIATMVYGNYDSVEVRVLRKYRDAVLEPTYTGRLFIKVYYFLSPIFVEIFKNNTTINKLIKGILDRIISKLNNTHDK